MKMVGFAGRCVVHSSENILALRLSILLSALIVLASSHPTGWTKELLPAEPDVSTRVDELYDHEARLFLILYSLEGNGKVDYVTGRLVQEYARSNYGNPVYQTEAQPLFYWWNHTMWNDPEQDGVNGNERVYQEGVEFDISRYKPCLFNGQPC
jgi:hypothetical protein